MIPIAYSRDEGLILHALVLVDCALPDAECAPTELIRFILIGVVLMSLAQNLYST
jgi:hypothetical protein